MPRRQWQHIRWFTRDDGRIEFEIRLNRENARWLQRAVDRECGVLERTKGPVPGGVEADTPEASERRWEAFQLVVRKLAHIFEVGAEALSGEPSSRPHI